MMHGKTSDYLSPFKILIVEPNQLMREVTRNILRLLGARRVVDVAGMSGAASFLQQGDIDFVLAEWYLEGSCGVDLVNWIRHAPSDTKFTPVIMVTSQTRMQNIIIARDAGITEIVAKPFSAKSLINRIRAVVERPRKFVRIGKYFGPDRRRRAEILDEGRDRRGQNSFVYGGDLTQDEINVVVAGLNRRP
jgi:two-component system, chemotaxis family, chemotaxis protein CheY